MCIDSSNYLNESDWNNLKDSIYLYSYFIYDDNIRLKGA